MAGKVDKFKDSIIKLNYISIYSVVIIFSVLSFLSVYYVLHVSLKRDIEFTTHEYITSKKATIKNQVDNLVNYIKYISDYEKQKNIEKMINNADFLINVLKRTPPSSYVDILNKFEKEYLYKIVLLKGENKIFSDIDNLPKKFLINQINTYNYKNSKFYLYPKKFVNDGFVYTLCLILDQKTIDVYVKKRIVDFVKSMEFVFNNGYLSIIKILDFKGGKKFAKFVAYPKNPDWEGLYLNDSKKDAKGNEYRKIYLKILKEKKEGFFVYWFKKKHKLYKKISYVKLYEPFNWAIFGGIYINEVDNIVNKKKKLIKKELRYIFIIYSVMSFLFLILIYFITEYENKLLKKVIEDYEKEISLKNQELEIVNEQLDTLNKNLQKEVVRKTEELLKSYFTDKLTLLPNREKFIKDIKRKNKGCIALLNIDSFKEINDFYGVETGDEILKKVAEIIKKHVPVYRLSADEYGILDDECGKTYKKIKDIIGKIEKNHIQIGGNLIEVSISAGIGKTLEEADMALKYAKSKKIGKIVIYDEKLEIAKQYKEYIEWKNIIKHAIRENDIIPYVQPIVDAKTYEPKKYEVLLRLKYKDKIYPPFFLDTAKKAGLYVDLQKIIITKSFEVFSEIDKNFSINLSVLELSNTGFREFLLTMIDKYKVSSKLTIELLEDEKLMDEELLGFLIYLREITGVEIAIDDFGSGHSNISYLIEKLPVTILKLDGSLIKDILKNENNRKLIKVIVNMADIFHLKTIAEFVENEQIATILADYGVDCLQGYYFSKPFDINRLKDG